MAGLTAISETLPSVISAHPAISTAAILDPTFLSSILRSSPPRLSLRILKESPSSPFFDRLRSIPVDSMKATRPSPNKRVCRSLLARERLRERRDHREPARALISRRLDQDYNRRPDASTTDFSRRPDAPLLPAPSIRLVLLGRHSVACFRHAGRARRTQPVSANGVSSLHPPNAIRPRAVNRRCLSRLNQTRGVIQTRWRIKTKLAADQNCSSRL